MTLSDPDTGSAAEAWDATTTSDDTAAGESTADDTSDRVGGGEHDDDLAEWDYEQARDELIKVVQQLETGGVPLADSLALWERGEKLAAICQQWLDGAKQRVEEARRADGSDTANE